MLAIAIAFGVAGARFASERPTHSRPLIAPVSTPALALAQAALAERARAHDGAGMPILLTYAQAKAAGYAVPELDPDLPICPPRLGPGFSTSVVDDAAVDASGPTICQLDVREASIRIGGP